MILNLRAYLDRIELNDPPPPTLEGLRTLHKAHLFKIPFENLDIELSNRIVLDLEHLERKIIHKKRGGFCYELNGLFSQLLKQLGFEVKIVAARVYRKEGQPGPEFDHMTLLVTIDGKQWLADVGFGENFLEPLAVKTDIIQTDPTGRYIVQKIKESEFVFSKKTNDNQYLAHYAFTTKERNLEDFIEMCNHHQTSSESIFLQGRICSLATVNGRVTLSKNRLIETVNDVKNCQLLKDENEVCQILKSYFNINL